MSFFADCLALFSNICGKVTAIDIFVLFLGLFAFAGALNLWFALVFSAKN